MQAVLFRQLREHYQQRDRLRLIVDYRRKFLDSLVRGGEEEAKQAEANYEQAKAQTDKDYEETAAAVADKKQLTADEAAELSRLWKKLVKLYHPDRFADQPDKLETYHKLTAAIKPGEGRGRHQDAAGDRGRPARLHPAAGLGDFGFQRRGGTRAVAAAV